MTRQEHLISCLAEESVEIAKICLNIAFLCSKSLRFGIDDHHPDEEATNRKNLVKELNDLHGVLELLKKEGVQLPGLYAINAIETKQVKIEKFMDYAEKKGTLITVKNCPECGYEMHLDGEDWQCSYCGLIL